MRYLILFILVILVQAMADDQKVLELTEDDNARLSEQRSVIEKYLQKNDLESKYETAIGKVGTLRALLEAKVFSPNQTYELQSMGIILGDAIVIDMGFHWVIVEDQYGRDPALKYKDTSIILYPLTMISKRVEKGEDIDVFELYNWIAGEVEEMKAKGY